MKYRTLTDENKKIIAEIHADPDLGWDQKMHKLEKYTNRASRTVRKWLREMGLTKPTEIIPIQYEEAKKRQTKLNKYYIVTWAQNNTPVHKMFLKNIEVYAKEIGAEIHVIAGRYKNPTSVWSNDDKNQEFWVDAVVPYLDAGRHDIHKNMTVMSDVKIQPTASEPLTGMKSMSKEKSCIFGHPKVHLEAIPVLEGSAQKMIMTTGSVTQPNYSDSKAGKKGEFHHTFGFVIVEIDNEDVYYSRQVTADDNGNFNDLFWNTSNGVVSRNHEIDSLIMGDLHHANHDPKVFDLTFNNLVVKLKPKNLIFHDIFDGESINHHEANNPFTQYKMELSGRNSLKNEVDNMLDFIESIQKFNFNNIVVVRSNHDDFVDRWLVDTDWRKTSTPKNSLVYMEYSTAILKGAAKKGIIPYLINNRFPEILCLGVNDSFKKLEWEFGQHGDRGTNGTRGTLMSFKNLNTKLIVGHSHSPGRKDGAISVGTSTHLRLPYNKGASSWWQSHAITHLDGKAQQIHFVVSPDGSMSYTTFE